jgi:bifunctional pyridoxal-dependent enzyme with beta-cystathionase and maltose regulon repressor activities
MKPDQYSLNYYVLEYETNVVHNTKKVWIRFENDCAPFGFSVPNHVKTSTHNFRLEHGIYGYTDKDRALSDALELLKLNKNYRFRIKRKHQHIAIVRTVTDVEESVECILSNDEIREESPVS